MSNWTSQLIKEPPLLSEADRQVFELINLVVICNIVSLLGIFSNIINIIVFYRQGLNNAVNISFFGLAISDICSLATLIIYNIWFNPLLPRFKVPVNPIEIEYLTAGLPHGCFTRITSWITVYITAEQCLCISLPLHIHRILTPARTITIICCIYLVMVLSLLPEYLTFDIVWRFNPGLNESILGLGYRDNNNKTEGITFLLYSIYMLASFAIVVGLTLTLVVQLRRKTKWRKTATPEQAMTLNTRDRQTVLMVIVNAGVLLLTFTPTVVTMVCGVSVAGFSVVGRHVNLFFMAWTFVHVFDALNGSLNTVLYFKTSSKFRQTFTEIFCLKRLQT
ncbi:uncharacterized protein LOC131957709 [Physella acuta]|uniref:uncharacterized protein LOC131957709 n=1 Tax=Physella acuta TaxID=109671 RepID=UPI0027DC4C70|nr:uncharacterized protein LOC131957709 [Physella acuta]